MLFWTKNDLKDFLVYISLDDYYPLITKAYIKSPKELLVLSEPDLKERINIKSFGHRILFYKAINVLKALNIEENKPHYKEDELFERIENSLLKPSISGNELSTLKREIKEIDTWSSGLKDSKTLESLNKPLEKPFEKEL